MQNNAPPKLSNKNLFSNFVFQTTKHKYKKDFRSDSFVDSLEEKRKSPKKSSYTQTNFRSQTNVNLSPTRKVEIFKENSTQTSKTAVAVVQTELDMRLSPDSLSPKQGAKTTHVTENDVISMMEQVLNVKELGSLSFNRKNNVTQYLEACEEFQRKKLLSGNSLTKAFLARVQNRTTSTTVSPQISKPQSLVLEQSSPKAKRTPSPTLKSQSYIEPPVKKELLYLKRATPKTPRPTRFTVKNVTEKAPLEEKTKPVKFYCRSKASNSSTIGRTRRSTSFMSPTVSSDNKDQSKDVKNIKKLISPPRRGRSVSPKKSSGIPPINSETQKKVPYIDTSNHTIESDPTIVRKFKNEDEGDKVEDLHLNLALSFDDMTNTSVSITSSTSTECVLFQAISKLKDSNWSTALRGLAEIVEICRVLDNQVIFPHMTVINQRIIEMIKSARSHVSRTACQAVGHLFEYVKDTRRPEFDELVNTLLNKTADANKFIRHDANLALDCMVTHIGTFHAIRAICSKGPDHKNPLVRVAAARLMICAVVIAGPENILHPHNNEYTRRRIILTMVKFLDDKNHESRKFGYRLYKLLYKDKIFDIYLKRYLERDVILRMKKLLKSPR